MQNTTLLKITCPDRVGLLAGITGFVAAQGGNLLEVHQFTDPDAAWFFARLAIDTGTIEGGPDRLRDEFAVLARELNAQWTIREASRRMRVVILVSKLDHCLADLLWRWQSGELDVEIPVVISNHDTLAPLVEREGVPFQLIPVDPADKESGFRDLATTLRGARPDAIVLARYMQILPDFLCEEFAGKIINIHHSFLPAFIGANPYRRAYERGVKLIGATCHYATPQLDDGPIIDQEVVRVEHYHQPEDLLRLGRDCERLALARGVRYHVADRVLVHGRRTIVFRD